MKEKGSKFFIKLLFFLSPLILNFSYAPISLFFLAYFSFLPLFYYIERLSPKKTFIYGFIYGFLFSFGHLWWLYFLKPQIALKTKILLFIGIIILFFYFAFYFGLFSYLTKITSFYLAPFILPILEFIRTKGEIGFPWGLIGYTQTTNLIFLNTASLFGIYGVSFLVIFINLLIYKIIFSNNKKPFILLIIGVIFLTTLHYFFRLKELPDYFKVALLQPNVSPEEKGTKEEQIRLLNQLISMTKKASKERPYLIIYPETASLIDITVDTPYKEFLKMVADTYNCYLFIGTPRYEEDKDGFKYYNGAVLFAPKKGIVNEYRKLHLVPFSERIPYYDKIKIFRLIETQDMGNYSKGKEYTVFNTDKIFFSCAICFEVIFPDLIREFVKRGAQMIVNITNDGWFGKTFGPYQHCELAIARAVENGVPLIRCANNGISLICDPFGRVKNKSKLFEEEIIFGNVKIPLKNTIYRQFGDWFIYLSVLIIFFYFIIKILYPLFPFKKK
ncbi:MAG: apolipoprotein N-acyltransferase [candidate division WOR-3 bacterium]|nr:apolipoprotein N-acyltransferase [candidate division WOR-3 bacterium]MDW8113984.1 apolipoprotein N-acyltransferase [candidate division WOR-3 bacterium]